MKSLNSYFEKAKKSPLQKWILNQVLWRIVPFNKPHRLKILEIEEDGITASAGYIRSNQNHIKGIHACLLATLCEYIVGLNLMLKISPKEYRIILKSIQMVYHYQAKGPVKVKWGISGQEVQDLIIRPLQTESAVFREFQADVYDFEGNHICTGSINWQLKAWSNVRTKPTI